MTMLNESKRDDLLLPYVELLKSKGINCTLSSVKRDLLQYFTETAGIRNLSLGSNFYLAGIARYYFNGDLTTNKDLALLNPNGGQDVWDEEICKRLNALVLILRNSIVDSIGQTFEQPEDFGTLTLPKLLKKYNKKITAELENSVYDEQETNIADTLDRNDRVGNGYTFDILYSYQEATKYKKATEPGAWCITYGEQHYKNYVKSLGIHYVIFRKDGYENVPRQKGPEWTKRKPQDEYGCSLIALLQSNKNGEPTYITSRWNHGYTGDDSLCEADHAFTKEEFFAKTGVTDADLQRIFEIWKTDHTRKSTDEYGEDEIVSREEKLNNLRKLKYAQMRINGGDVNVSDTIKILKNLNGDQSEIIDGTVKINKGLYWCENAFEANHKIHFLMDKGKIIYETITYENDFEIRSTNILDTETRAYSSFKALYGYKDLIILVYKRYILLYDIRRHSIIKLDDTFKFKGVPRLSRLDVYNPSTVFYQVAVRKEQFALLNLANNTPLKLPNGSVWINKAYSNGSKNGGYSTSVIGNTNIPIASLGGGEGCVIEIIYDASSGEQYFYNVDEKRFLTPNELPQHNANYLHIYNEFNYSGYIAYTLSKDLLNTWYLSDGIILTKDNGKRISIANQDEFQKITNLGNGFIGVNFKRGQGWYKQAIDCLYNLQTNEIIKNPETGEIANFDSVEIQIDYSGGGYNKSVARFLFLRPYNTQDIFQRYIFDKKTMEFVKNPINFPSPYTFLIYMKGDIDGNGIIFAKTDSPHSPYGNEPPYVWRQDYLRLYIPGIENNDIYHRDNFTGTWSNIPLSNTISGINLNRDNMAQIVAEVTNKILKQL